MNNHAQPPTPAQYLNNGLSMEQNAQAVSAIGKLKVHDLSSIISHLNIRRPRVNKMEQQKALYAALFDTAHSMIVWKMAVQLTTPQSYDNAVKRTMANANRNHPYMHNGVRNGTNGANGGHMMQFHVPLMPQQMFQHPQQHHQQQQQQAQRIAAPPFEIVPLPFYDVIATLLHPVELHASANAQKQTKSQGFHFTLTTEQAQKIYRHEGNPLPRYEVQLRFYNITDLGQVAGALKDDFPLNANVRVDEQQVQLPHVIPTNKPNVEPKRPSRPVNITPQLWRFNINSHKIVIDWLGDRRSYAAAITFVHRVDANILFERIDKNPAKHKSIELTKQTVREKLTGTGEEDIAMDRVVISLLDPLIKSRMVTPSRCMDCTHLQCFDLSSYLKMNEKKPTWQCPVCSSYCPYDRLIIDDYFLDMLAKVDKSTTEVELKEDGSYDVIGVDEEVCLSDDDDDIKPIVMGGASSSSNGGASSSSSEPPQNGGKKKTSRPPAEEDIIVLSDDDDDNDAELNRGILMSLNDLAVNSGRQPAPIQKTPPRPVKKSKSDEIEIITLDDTPPRPARQMSLQVPSSSSGPSSASVSQMQSVAQPATSTSAGGPAQNISDALAAIGGAPPTSRVNFSYDQQQQRQHQHQQQQQQMQSSFQAVQAAQAAAAVSQQQQYGYSALNQSMAQQQQQFHLQNQMIGRVNQLGPMGHPQQQQQQGQQQHAGQQQQGQQGMMNAGFYGQQQANRGAQQPTGPSPPQRRPILIPLAPRPLLEIPMPSSVARPRAVEGTPGVTQRKYQAASAAARADVAPRNQ